MDASRYMISSIQSRNHVNQRHYDYLLKCLNKLIFSWIIQLISLIILVIIVLIPILYSVLFEGSGILGSFNSQKILDIVYPAIASIYTILFFIHILVILIKLIHTKILLLKSETRIANDDDIYKSKERVDLSNLNIKDYFDDKQFKFNLVIDNLNFTWLFKSQTIVKASVLSNFVFNKNFETFQNNLYILLFYSNITPLNDSDSTITEDERLYIWSKRKFIFNEYIIN